MKTFESLTRNHLIFCPSLNGKTIDLPNYFITVWNPSRSFITESINCPQFRHRCQLRKCYDWQLFCSIKLFYADAHLTKFDLNGNWSFASQLIFISSGNTEIRQAMENSSAITEYKKSIRFLLCTAHSSGKHWAFISAINFFFSTTAIFGNTLILVALHKESSLHPPSKHLYRCLAVTDLLGGLISEPSLALYYAILAKEHHHLTNLCFYFATISVVSFTTLSAVSLLTMTTISLDRLLALLLGLRYRHIVTLRRVRSLVTFYWFLSVGFAVMTIWEFTFAKR